MVASVISIGHLSTTALAASTLGSMTASVSGFSIIQGFASTLDTMLPSAWTSSQPQLVGLWAQRMGKQNCASGSMGWHTFVVFAASDHVTCLGTLLTSFQLWLWRLLWWWVGSAHCALRDVLTPLCVANTLCVVELGKHLAILEARA